MTTADKLRAAKALIEDPNATKAQLRAAATFVWSLHWGSGTKSLARLYRQLHARLQALAEKEESRE